MTVILSDNMRTGIQPRGAEFTPRGDGRRIATALRALLAVQALGRVAARVLRRGGERVRHSGSSVASLLPMARARSGRNGYLRAAA
mgnify:CR=1 FL=1